MDFNLGFGQVKMVKTYDLLKNLKILIIISDLTYIRLFHVNYMYYVTFYSIRDRKLWPCQRKLEINYIRTMKQLDFSTLGKLKRSSSKRPESLGQG